MRRFLVCAVAVLAGGAAAWLFGIRPYRQTWGREGDETTRPLPGDDILPDGLNADTRGITIDAPAAAVWPWLVQMGYGRGGWYSYDAIDMRGASLNRIVPELQSLEVGDIVPTHPGGGFVVKAIDPGRSLVLYFDMGLAREQAEAVQRAAAEKRAAGDSGPSPAESPANLRATSTFLSRTTPPDFAATWSFVVEDAGPGRTRLLTRFRLKTAQHDRPGSRVAMSLLGFGVFVMVRKQLLGIKARAEARAEARPEAPDQAPGAAGA